MPPSSIPVLSRKLCQSITWMSACLTATKIFACFPTQLCDGPVPAPPTTTTSSARQAIEGEVFHVFDGAAVVACANAIVWGSVWASGCHLRAVASLQAEATKRTRCHPCWMISMKMRFPIIESILYVPCAQPSIFSVPTQQRVEGA
jgi:hypothetical protein